MNLPHFKEGDRVRLHETAAPYDRYYEDLDIPRGTITGPVSFSGIPVQWDDRDDVDFCSPWDLALVDAVTLLGDLFA